MFGGLQIIVAGDFFQLPPVKNTWYFDEGRFSFESLIWKSAIPHHINLEEIYRQKDGQLINAVNELGRTSMSKTTSDFIKSLNRPLPPNLTPVKLFATNEEVDFLNHISIENFPGQVTEYVSEDRGDPHRLQRQVTAPKRLWVKIGCPVILLRNLSDKLVNGAHGKVTRIDSTGPTVHFEKAGISMKMEKYAFSGKYFVICKFFNKYDYSSKFTFGSPLI